MSALSGKKRVEFLDVDFDVLTIAELSEAISARDPEGRFEYVVTPNVDHIVKLHRHGSVLREMYRDAGYVACDSRIVALLASWAQLGLPVVPGSDLTAHLFENVIKADDSVIVVGGRRGEIERLRARYGLRALRHHEPPMNLLSNPAAIEEAAQFVVANKARYIFFALGSPQQEMVAHKIRQTNGARGTAFCIGASIDFLTGANVRAPRLMQGMRLEWLYRLIREPRRLWRRYLVDDPAILAIYWRWRRERRLK